MDRPDVTRLLARVVLLAVPGLGLLMQPAAAHRLMIFAAPEGAEVLGEAFYEVDEPVAEAQVRVYGPDDTLLHETVTDARGQFAFTATQRVDHTIVCETADGHAARWTLPADALPENLGQDADAVPEPESRPEAEPVSEPEMPASRAGVAPSEMEEMIARAVAREVRPLRAALARYEARVRFHDIVGGVGYIVGVAGLLFFIKARTRGTRG